MEIGSILIVIWVAWYFTDSLLIGLVVGAVMIGANGTGNEKIDASIDQIKIEIMDAVEEQHIHTETDREEYVTRDAPEQNERTEFVSQSIDEQIANLPTDNIGDQLRKTDEAYIVDQRKACGTDGTCFDYKLRKHLSGQVYVCEVDGIGCYELKQ
jgi:hypothetical protein